MQLKDFKYPVRVYIEDTDCNKIVYHSNYLNFAERTRTEWLRTFGFSKNNLFSEFSSFFVVTKIEVSFKKPAFMDDMLIISCFPVQISAARIYLVQEIFRDDILLTHINLELALMNEYGKVIRIPHLLRQLFKATI